MGLGNLHTTTIFKEVGVYSDFKPAAHACGARNTCSRATKIMKANAKFVRQHGHDITTRFINEPKGTSANEAAYEAVQKLVYASVPRHKPKAASQLQLH